MLTTFVPTLTNTAYAVENNETIAEPVDVETINDDIGDDISDKTSDIIITDTIITDTDEDVDSIETEQIITEAPGQKQKTFAMEDDPVLNEKDPVRLKTTGELFPH